ncbi:hypothetical protein A7Q10_03365 [Methylacidiphilum caldifontis]|uniref:Uncharacterized protein n=1 Tax=Methylacidiphilum caldifontis TaxID=2795386 RepID=A0A4Y8PH27_9BACT|nr:hypothetical protein A7Q10_03365 [Methylacidiphilum caldifontis]
MLNISWFEIVQNVYQAKVFIRGRTFIISLQPNGTAVNVFISDIKSCDSFYCNPLISPSEMERIANQCPNTSVQDSGRGPFWVVSGSLDAVKDLVEKILLPKFIQSLDSVSPWDFI